MSCQRVIDGRQVGRDVGSGEMSLATSCDITQHYAIGSGSGSGAGGVRCHSTKGIAEERRGGRSGSGRQAGVGSRSGRRAGVGSVRGSPYSSGTADAKGDAERTGRDIAECRGMAVEVPAARGCCEKAGGRRDHGGRQRER